MQDSQRDSLKEADSLGRDPLDSLLPLYDLELGCDVQSPYSYFKLRIDLWIEVLQKNNGGEDR